MSDIEGKVYREDLIGHRQTADVPTYVIAYQSIIDSTHLVEAHPGSRTIMAEKT